ncbi:MAG TPA: PadR family transcriptional regulator [Geminicoccaceae bacterium]|nr:PadR family transcriptional regulator [Geminicoccus sp.]HMU50356.1 PadR family transcriptional regulator [Geminicoccaceae bacterium]
MDTRTLCLGVLTERAMSGYEIKKHFEEAFRHFFAAGFGSIYPALAELAREGLVTVENVEQVNRPDKKVYRITPAGRGQLQQELMLADPVHRLRSEFLVLMYFSHLLPPEHVGRLIDRRISELEHGLSRDLDACDGGAGTPDAAPLTPGQRFTLGYGRMMVTAATSYLRRHKGTLLRELEAEPAASLPRAAE